MRTRSPLLSLFTIVVAAVVIRGESTGQTASERLEAAIFSELGQISGHIGDEPAYIRLLNQADAIGVGREGLQTALLAVSDIETELSGEKSSPARRRYVAGNAISTLGMIGDQTAIGRLFEIATAGGQEFGDPATRSAMLIASRISPDQLQATTNQFLEIADRTTVFMTLKTIMDNRLFAGGVSRDQYVAVVKEVIIKDLNRPAGDLFIDLDDMLQEYDPDYRWSEGRVEQLKRMLGSDNEYKRSYARQRLIALASTTPLSDSANGGGQASLDPFVEGTFEHKVRTELTSIDRGIEIMPTHERLLALAADVGKSGRELQAALLALVDYHRSHSPDTSTVRNSYIAASAIGALAMVGDASIVPAMISIIEKEDRELSGPALKAAIYPSFRADPDTLYSTISRLSPNVDPSVLYRALGETLENIPSVKDGSEKGRRDVLLAFLFKAWELRLSDDVTYLDGVLARNDAHFKSSEERVQRLKEEVLSDDDFVRRYSVRMLAELGVAGDLDADSNGKDASKRGERRHGDQLEGSVAKPEVTPGPVKPETTPSGTNRSYGAIAVAAFLAAAGLVMFSMRARQ